MIFAFYNTNYLCPSFVEDKKTGSRLSGELFPLLPGERLLGGIIRVVDEETPASLTFCIWRYRDGADDDDVNDDDDDDDVDDDEDDDEGVESPSTAPLFILRCLSPKDGLLIDEIIIFLRPGGAVPIRRLLLFLSK